LAYLFIESAADVVSHNYVKCLLKAFNNASLMHPLPSVGMHDSRHAYMMWSDILNTLISTFNLHKLVNENWKS